MRPKVLIVEDERSIADPLKDSLEREGFTPVVASTGGEALSSAEFERPDVILLDLMLPDMDGRDVCRKLREFSATPIIMVTARGEEVDRVLGLELGADDYVVKPFSAKELAARIRAVLRRSQPATSSDDITIGGIQLQGGARRVLRDNEQVPLSAREFDLLSYLMQNAGKVVKREDIMSKVWDEHWFGPTKTLDVHISWLRRKLESDPSDPQLIQTVRGVGFMFTDQELG